MNRKKYNKGSICRSLVIEKLRGKGDSVPHYARKRTLSQNTPPNYFIHNQIKSKPIYNPTATLSASYGRVGGSQNFSSLPQEAKYITSAILNFWQRQSVKEGSQLISHYPYFPHQIRLVQEKLSMNRSPFSSLKKNPFHSSSTGVHSVLP